MSSDRITFINPPGDETIHFHAFQQDMIDRLGSLYGLPVDYFNGQKTMTKAEAEERVAAYRERYAEMTRLWDAAVLLPVVNNAAFFVAISTPRERLRLWRWEIGKTITKRQYRRLRGRVKAGKPIADPPAMTINFDHPPCRRLTPFISPLGDTRRYQKD